MSEKYIYTVFLRVDVGGPDEDWRDVADRLAKRVRALPLGDGFGVTNAWVDEATVEEETA